MNTTWLRLAGVAGAFLLVIVTGFWLRQSGRPYGTGLLTAHKLISVGILAVLGVSAYGANKVSGLGAYGWATVSLAILAFVAAIASGGVLSAVESPPTAVSILHKVAPYATVLLTAAALYEVLWKRAVA